MIRYQPTTADLDFRDAMQDDADDFTLALLMQHVSPAYLAVMAHDHAVGNTESFRSMIDFEIARRGTAEAQRANAMAKWAIGLSGLACLISIAAIIFD